MLPIKRSQRVVFGVVCLIVTALVMGWFIGRYIPGEPKAPLSKTSGVLAWDTGRAAENIVESKAGTTLILPALQQGSKYEYDYETLASMGTGRLKTEQYLGAWEYTCPSLALSVVESRIIETRSLYDLDLGYADDGIVLDDAKTILVTVSITNMSDKTYAPWWRTLPTMTLWNSNLINGNDTLGAGIRLDAIMLFSFNQATYYEDRPGSLLEIVPGETQELVVPFLIVRNVLADQSAFDQLKPSDFCIQTADYDTGTTYRLWL